MNHKARFLHILEAVQYVEEFLIDKESIDLVSDLKLRFAIERQLEIIG
jgi:uncharacterized protein with HEPN domain